MNLKFRRAAFALVASLLLSIYVMGHHYVAHDVLSGGGGAATIAFWLGMFLPIALGMHVAITEFVNRNAGNDRRVGYLSEDKAPPVTEEPKKTRHELRQDYKMKCQQEEENRREAIKEYIDVKMVPFFKDDDSLDILFVNIIHWNKSETEGFEPKPLNPSHGLTQWDIRHFVWNIGERLGWSGAKRARFAKLCFPVRLQGVEEETIRRTLKQSSGLCSIEIDEPDGPDDFRFHYNTDK